MSFDFALFIKSLHVISVIAWMASLLYLPRLFVYHTSAEIGSVQSETFKIMERRLMKAIATPSMIGTWVFGLWTAWIFGVWSEAWFLLKLAAVIGLSAIHMFLAGCLRAFANDQNSRSERFFRVINEVPAVIMIVVVLLVVMKPF